MHDVLVCEKEVQILRHVPDLLGHSVAVHHEHEPPGGATEHVHGLAPDPVVAGDVDQADGGLVGDHVGHLVVLHAGVRLDSLATAQLGQDRGLARVTGPNDQDV